ncbi:hypothetical protein [Effusibacillus dendaii]|uniref:hypothetical protein n=1 Tax=Effusibacillus dendaii TaxID=2743772 RepID=UPI0019092066|nr:hypothetical protein [Effusibacillus dendaii]
MIEQKKGSTRIAELAVFLYIKANGQTEFRVEFLDPRLQHNRPASNKPEFVGIADMLRRVTGVF